MVDAARQMLDELMGRNRNLHPSEAGRKVNWDDPDFCQYHIVKFCPHDLFINTRADLGPCPRIHDDEAKEMYEQARPTHRKRQFEDEFLRFCNTMLNDVDRKIQKGKQRLQLMHRDQPMPVNQMHVSKYQEQLNNLNARIKKLLCEAEEAGIRGDVDQAQDLMTLCEQLKDEKDALVAQHENNANSKDVIPPERTERSLEKSPGSDGDFGDNSEEGSSRKSEGGDKKVPGWMHDLGTLPEKQMEVCETCGAFLIVGDAQQRIEDHLMGKQHLGYSKLRKAVEEIQEKRKQEREEEENKRREERSMRITYNFSNDRRRDRDQRDIRDIRDQRDPRDLRDSRDMRDSRDIRDSRDQRDSRDIRDSRDQYDQRDQYESRDQRERDYRGRSRDYNHRNNNHQPMDRHRHRHKSHHRRSHSRGNSARNHRRNSRDRSRSCSQSRY